MSDAGGMNNNTTVALPEDSHPGWDRLLDAVLDDTVEPEPDDELGDRWDGLG